MATFERMSKTKDTLVRFSVAIGGELLKRFDRYREEHQYPNRSEAVRGLMRDALIEEKIEADQSQAMGVLTLVYDHHKAGIADRLTELQHHQVDRVISTTHVHLDESRCLEVILLRGPAGEVRAMADLLIGVKGIETGRLVLAAAESVTNGHSHAHPHSHSHSHPHENGPKGKK
jgi:CopG family transcriptional regulator, nickel-responsive regulator